MARVGQHQSTALDVLDWLSFDQALVRCAYGVADRGWMLRLLERLKSAVASTGATGKAAECIKHTVLCLMEVALQDSMKDVLVTYSETLPGGFDPTLLQLPEGIDPVVYDRVHSFQRDFFMGAVLGIGQKARTVDLNVATTIAYELIPEFRTAPASVRFRLTERMLAFEFEESPLQFFSWLLEQDVLRSTKWHSHEATRQSDEDVITRIGLLCEFETIRNWIISCSSSPDAEHVMLAQAPHGSNNAKKQLLEYQYFWNLLDLTKKRSMTAFFPDRLRNKEYARQFVRNVGRSFPRMRLVPGTQGRWLSMIGALMVSIRKAYVAPEAAIYDECNNDDSNTAAIAKYLANWGFEIEPRTLYLGHKHYVREIAPRIKLYHEYQIRTGFVPSPHSEDLGYAATIVLTSKDRPSPAGV